MHKPHARLSQYLSLAAMILITIVAIYNKNISVFYIIYLFWWDEFLKTVFYRLRYHFKKDLFQNPAQVLNGIKPRLFFLFIYIVFIIVIFGLVINWKDHDLIIMNLEVLFFKNTFFNITLLTFLLREIAIYRIGSEQINLNTSLSKGVITLHVSIVLGILLWFLVSKKFILFTDHAVIFSIIPFLLLKIFFEVMEIKDNSPKASSQY
ncbi:hypothetical protein [Gelidibacter maritimus]|uniref:Uncharacterized protein n=1 Tax=Gelidibacter maritimus TaxID=2761487 RepID=A0A7W2M3L2_9FLAO|nr:hypothetical protein [Gelidibacter maritimus]MBA6152094.1 hypothetical protein [Gelidibacter maritimus]